MRNRENSNRRNKYPKENLKLIDRDCRNIMRIVRKDHKRTSEIKSTLNSQVESSNFTNSLSAFGAQTRQL